MTNFNFLSKSSSQSCGHSSVTLASTVGSPSAHRRSTMLRLLSVLVLIFTIGVGNVWGGDLTVTLNYEGSGTFPYNSDWSSGGSVSTDQHYGGSQCAQFATTANDVYITYKGNLTNVKSISLWGNRTSTNTTHPTFSVEKSTDNGSSWNEVVAASTFTLSRNSWTQKIIEIPEAKRFTGWVRLKYKCGSSAVKFIDDIVITYESTCNSLTMSTVTAAPGDKQIELSWQAVSHADSYTVTCKNGNSNAGTIGNVTSNGTMRTCTISNLTNGTEYTWSVMPVGSGDYCIDNTPASGNVTPNLYHTVTWQTHNGVFATTQVLDGQKPTFPKVADANPTSCDTGEGASTTFYGWATSTWSGKAATLEDSKLSGITIYTSAASMATVTTDDVVYYAVFCKGSAGTEVMNEAFDNSSSSDSSTKITTLTFSNFPGLTNYAYKSQYGGLKLGSGSYVGYITSKSLDLSSAFTVSIDARKYGTDDANISVTVGSTTKTISNSSFGTSEYKTCTLDFDAATSSSTVSITTVYASSKYRAYIDNVVVTRKGAASNFMTTCCQPLGQINGSFLGTTHFGALSPEKFRPERP